MRPISRSRRFPHDSSDPWWQVLCVSIKAALKSTPIIGPIIAKLRRARYVASSADYWESRYRSGGDSGAGSYNRLAEFKAEFLNKFVVEHDIQSVIEFGCGDGGQLALATYPCYTGIDVSRTVIDHCRDRFASEVAYSFLHSSEATNALNAQLTLSLDVIYHLVEDVVFDRYMHELFNASARWVIIYASNEDRTEALHVRHRKFSNWIKRRRPDFELRETVRNRYPFDPTDPANTSFADFYVFERV